MSTFQQKLKISFGSALLFAAVNLPATYQFTNQISPLPLFNSATNCPTKFGLLAHTLVFFAVTFATMGDPTKNTGIKLKHSLYGTLIFSFLSSPMAYTLTGSLLGPQIASSTGCPTLLGVLLHAVLYCAALVGVMYLPDN